MRALPLYLILALLAAWCVLSLPEALDGTFRMQDRQVERTVTNARDNFHQEATW